MAFLRDLFICLSVLALSQAAPRAGKPLTINETNWRQILEGEWMVEFMAPWCPACRGFTETWKNFAGWSEDLGIHVGVVDVTENPGLSGRFLVSALPTIYHVKEGQFRQYKGGRKDNDLVSFVDDKKWTAIEVVSWYLSPNSLQMGAVGYFFKAAMHIRTLYNMMTTEYGIPEWACYVIFAILTICLGLLLGLLVVCCCDMVFPPKYYPQAPPPQFSEQPEQSEKLEEKDDDDDTQDLIDDTEKTEDEDEGDDKSQGTEETEEDEVKDEIIEDKYKGDSGSESTKPRKRRPKKAD